MGAAGVPLDGACRAQEPRRMRLLAPSTLKKHMCVQHTHMPTRAERECCTSFQNMSEWYCTDPHRAQLSSSQYMHKLDPSSRGALLDEHITLFIFVIALDLAYRRLPTHYCQMRQHSADKNHLS